MQNIGGFLERYKNFIPPPLAAARAVRSAILEILGVSVAEQSIQVKNGDAFVSAPALEKSEMFLNKEQILAHTQKAVGSAVRDIR